MNDKLGLHTMDASAVAVILGVFFGMLPNIAALLTVVWMGLRVYEAFLSVQALRKHNKVMTNTTELVQTINDKVKTDDADLKP